MSGKDVREFLYTNMRAQRGFETDDGVGMHNAPAFTDAQRDDRVLLLLGQLGERLVRSERERIEMKDTVGRYADIIDSLEAKVNRQAALEAEMRARQEKLEQDYQEQMQKMHKAVVLAERIEEAINQQNRLSRRMEQMTQDKARMLRKLERIEEAVVETQSALNAKSLVLVSDQNLAVNDPSARIPRPANQNDGLLQGTLARRLASTAAAFALIAGLSFGVYKSMPTPGFDAASRARATENLLMTTPYASEAAQGHMSATPPLEELAAAQPESAPQEDLTVQPFAATEAAPADMGEDTRSASAVSSEASPVTAPAAPSSILQQSDDELMNMLNDDPDALAAALNNIAPGAVGIPQAMNEPVREAAHREAPTVSTPAAPQAADPAIGDFIKAQTDQRPLKERIQPDNSLPSQIKTVEARAFDGVPEAQHDLAALYTAGQGGVKADFARAAAWFEEAAINGIANARYNLGVLYHQGLGVTQDTNKALNWYKAAAAQNHPEAQYNLGIAYIEGVGATYDPAKAAGNFESAARAGIMEAAYNLGLIHENGLLGAPQIEEAIYWYNRAAENGSPEGKAALNQLARNMGYSEERVKEIYKARKAAWDNKPAPAAKATAQKIAPIVTGATVTPASAPAASAKASSERASSGANAIPVLPLDEEASARSGDLPAGFKSPADQEVHQIVQVKKKGSGSAVSASVIAQIQEQLILYGFYPGPADGRLSDVMADSIRSYQRTYDLTADGRASEALLVHMLAQEMGSQE